MVHVPKGRARFQTTVVAQVHAKARLVVGIFNDLTLHFANDLERGEPPLGKHAAPYPAAAHANATALPRSGPAKPFIPEIVGHACSLTANGRV